MPERGLHSFIDEPPACIRFYPSNPDFFVVGTYHLTPDPPDEFQHLRTAERSKVKFGSLRFHFLQRNPLISTTIHRERTPYAILDLAFCPFDPSLLAVATSTGRVALCRFGLQDPANLSFAWERDINAFNESISVTSLAWFPERSYVLAVTGTEGHVKIIDPNSQPVKTIWDWQAHSDNVWCAAWYNPRFGGKRLLTTGGDDSKISVWDIDPLVTRPDLFSDASRGKLPANHLLQACGQRWAEDTKTHKAGVTALLQLADKILLTGSYDEYVRIVKLTENSNQCITIAKRKLDGGVWGLRLIGEMRLDKEHPGWRAFFVLASCMAAGPRVLKVGHDANGQWEIRLVEEFKEHESLNYASDIQPLKEGDDPTKRILVTTSFYDMRVCVWEKQFGSAVECWEPICCQENSSDIQNIEITKSTRPDNFGQLVLRELN